MGRTVSTFLEIVGQHASMHFDLFCKLGLGQMVKQMQQDRE